MCLKEINHISWSVCICVSDGKGDLEKLIG